MTVEDSVLAAIHTARHYIDTRNYERAREILRTALAENPDDPGLLTEYARAEICLQHFESAAQVAYAALGRAPQDALAMRMYASALNGLGRWYEAWWMAWRTATTHPDDYLAHYDLARILAGAGQLQYALTAANESIRLQPNDADTFVLRGSILKKLGRIGESNADYQQALRIAPEHASAVNNLAVNRLAAGKFSSALRGFLGAARLDPSLGQLARDNVGVVVLRVLRQSSIVVVALAFFVVVMLAVHDDGSPTIVPRVLIGLCTTALVVILVWILRTLPRRTLASVMRKGGMLSLRMALLVVGIVVGVTATVFGPNPVFTAVGFLFLLFSVIVVFAGRLAGG
ncbi:tetratricopeptide repeat protein [Mycobacterium sp. MMS18-G62]